jgi:hypothetical protein
VLVLKTWLKTFHINLQEFAIDFGNKPFVEKLFFIKEAYDMFGFFTDIKTRLLDVEAKVEAILTHIHTKAAAEFVASQTVVEADVAKVEDKAIVAAVPAPVVAAVEAEAPKAAE